ncbi:hypothetical protein LTR53_017520 [Teratosphaeriaceae sp. CCFEE 6253]|nr:hypothetical protein LTR53_017520 [Teratosphaeriaceae sp. CCFEE 6253]
MKTDHYLTLCLEQAAKSPLHYRHGCVIVRGGKVIGQGFNDYRPGYDGGALKHGRVAKHGLDGRAMAELKERVKKQRDKRQEKPQQQQEQPQSGNTFVPFEGNGGGHLANVPLSMHSEMMAIHSALAGSATLSSTALAREKPCFKVPRSDKRKARLRAEVLKRYVEAVCGTAAQGTAKLQGRNNNKVEDEEEDAEWEAERELSALRRTAQQGGVQHVLKECRRAFHVPLSGEKHHQHQKRKEKEDEYEYQYEGQCDRSGQQTQQVHGRQQRQSASKQRQGHDTARKLDSTMHGVMTEMSRQACVEKVDIGKQQKDYKHSGKMKMHESTQPEPILLPKGHTGHHINDRRKHPRLVGADLYVARLGWCKTKTSAESKSPPTAALNTPQIGTEVSSDSSIETLSATSSNTTTPGCLHDELTNRDPSPRPSPLPRHATLKTKVVRASRPCYRCISHMHVAGIKRVFWTNDAGEWEGGKVRDLVDALEDSMDSVAKGAGGGPIGNGVFVTKHEVLMLKRL